MSQTSFVQGLPSSTGTQAAPPAPLLLLVAVPLVAVLLLLLAVPLVAALLLLVEVLSPPVPLLLLVAVLLPPAPPLAAELLVAGLGSLPQPFMAMTSATIHHPHPRLNDVIIVTRLLVVLSVSTR